MRSWIIILLFNCIIGQFIQILRVNKIKVILLNLKCICYVNSSHTIVDLYYKFYIYIFA